MQKEIKKFLSLGVLVFGVIFLAGCGVKTENAKPASENIPMQKKTTEQKKSNETVTKEDNQTKTNQNSAVSASDEESFLSREEEEANADLSVDQDLDDLANSYDETNL